MLRFSKWSFIVILLFFLLIIMAARNIKQTIKKDYNIQSCQWMVCDHFRQPFLISTTVCSFLCTVNYFLCAFSAKIATYSLVIDIVYSRNVQKTWANVLWLSLWLLEALKHSVLELIKIQVTTCISELLIWVQRSWHPIVLCIIKIHLY